MKAFFLMVPALLTGMFTVSRGQSPMSMSGPTSPHSSHGPDTAPGPDTATGPKTVIYHLYITDTMVNYTGKRRHAIAVNGSLPGPTLSFTEGDTAVIYIHNEMMMATTVHWHGLIVPNEYDGVAYLTSPPIGAMQTYVAKFPIVQNGTYWYHTHMMLQEQIGLYGAIVIHKRQEPPMNEYTVLLSDWTDERPYEVQRSLHYATDWYAIRKGSTQDYAQAIRQGYFKTKLRNEWKRMLPMDVSDVAYDRFLINGHPGEEQLQLPAGEKQPQLRAGDKVRLRIINGSSSTYFWLRYAGGKMAVVASDGKDVVPVEVDRMIIGVSETYDVIVTIPDTGSYAFQATAEDRTGAATLWLGSGLRHGLKPLPPLNYFEGMKMMNGMMKMDGDLNSMGMNMSDQLMDMNMVMYPETGEAMGDTATPNMAMDYSANPPMSHSRLQNMVMPGMPVTLNYGMLRSPVPTTLPAAPTKTLRFNLTGNMNRYVWTINNETVSEANRILIKKGENIRIILYNGTMMRHPMHLHGHFFRLIGGQGEFAPMKEVVDIMPMETDTLEFAATESGDWFFHCHILYHMMSGMGRIFHYEDTTENPEHNPNHNPEYNPAQNLQKVYADDREIRPMAKVGLESNGSDGEAMLADTRYRFQTEWRLGTDASKGYESESHFGRYLGRMQYWLPYIGWDFRYRRTNQKEKNLFGQTDTKDHRNVFCAGVQYTLPLLLVLDGRVDTKGNLRLQLGREDVALTDRLRFSFMVNTDKEYMAGLRYIFTKYIGLSTHYDSDMGFGAGVTLNY
jgi:CopA family copper-resistance protein